jgi:transcriptional regulator with XRE-family HTH domain
MSLSKHDIDQAVGLRLFNARSDARLTQQRLAKLARVSVGTIERAEAGGGLKCDTAARLAHAMGLPECHLLQIALDQPEELCPKE